MHPGTASPTGGRLLVTYFPQNYIPLYGGGEDILHFILRCMVARAVYLKNGKIKKWAGQKRVESEKLFFENEKVRGDVFDPFEKILYEIEKDTKHINEKRKTFFRSSEVERVYFIVPYEYFDLSEVSEFEYSLSQIWKKVFDLVENYTP